MPNGMSQVLVLAYSVRMVFLRFLENLSFHAMSRKCRLWCSRIHLAVTFKTFSIGYWIIIDRMIKLVLRRIEKVSRSAEGAIILDSFFWQRCYSKQKMSLFRRGTRSVQCAALQTEIFSGLSCSREAFVALKKLIYSYFCSLENWPECFSKISFIQRMSSNQHQYVLRIHRFSSREHFHVSRNRSSRHDIMKGKRQKEATTSFIICSSSGMNVRQRLINEIFIVVRSERYRDCVTPFQSILIALLAWQRTEAKKEGKKWETFNKYCDNW